MGLDAATLSLALQYAFSKANTGFDSARVGPKKKTYTLGSSAAWDQLYLREYTIAAAGTQTVDCSSFTDLAGNAVTPTKAVLLMLIPTGTNAKVKLEPGAANPLTWFLAGTTPSFTINTGDVFVATTIAGQTIDGTHKNLLLTNTGSGSLTLDFLLGVKTT